MKKVAIMQPYLFPYIGYFQLIHSVDEFVVFDDVNYIKRGWVNRNNILVNGEKKLFSIQVKGGSSNKFINELDIQDDFVKFIKMIEISYAKAPFKQPALDLLKKICNYEDKNLARFSSNSLKEISEYLGIETKFSYSSDVDKNEELKGQDKIIAICKKLGASSYINPIGGVELYDKEIFRRENIKLNFLKSDLKEYKQFNNDFIPGLSIIDLMMFNSASDIKKMLEMYELQ